VSVRASRRAELEEEIQMVKVRMSEMTRIDIQKALDRGFGSARIPAKKVAHNFSAKQKLAQKEIVCSSWHESF
jgi:hypothetical protein